MWENYDTSKENDLSRSFNDSYDASVLNTGSAVRAETIIPVMIRHLKRPENDLSVWGTTVNIVSFLGIVQDIEQGANKITYKIKDDTGDITAYQWLQFTNNPKPKVDINIYVRIYGHLKEQNGETYVLILRLWPLTNLNELTNHLLEVTYVMLKAKSNFNKDRSIVTTETDNMSMTDDNSVNGLSKDQAIVFKLIQTENDSEDGIERDVLKARVPKHILPYVDVIIDFLISEGHIYTTLTDDYFKTIVQI